MAAIIELSQVSKRFQLGDQSICGLDRVDLQVQRGDYVSVMGPSGSGKSTLLNILGLLDRPDQGHYLLAATATEQLPEEARARLRSRHIGFVFQSYHLIARLSARENIELPLLLAGVARKQRRQRSDQLLHRLGLSERAHHLPRQLSGGQRQRVAIARALITEPELLLADEPTGNLDSQSGREVMELLEQLNRDGITLVMVTHDTVLGARARRHIRMCDGAIVDDDSGAGDATG